MLTFFLDCKNSRILCYEAYRGAFTSRDGDLRLAFEPVQTTNSGDEILESNID